MGMENRELQIRLARLQADVRVYTTGIFASAAAVLTLLLPVYQYIVEYWETMVISVPKTIVSILFICVATTFAYFASRFYKKLESSRNELNNLG